LSAEEAMARLLRLLDQRNRGILTDYEWSSKTEDVIAEYGLENQ